MAQGGRDFLPEIRARLPSWARRPEFAGALPSKYLRYYAEREAVCREQAARPCPRAQELLQLRAALLAECRSGDGSAPLPSGRRRATPWYERVVAPVARARAAGADIALHGNTAAGPGHPFAPAAVVVERKLCIGQRVRAAEPDACPPALRPFLARLAAADELAYAAARARTAAAVRAALRAHPLCDHLNGAALARLGDAVLAAA